MTTSTRSPLSVTAVTGSAQTDVVADLVGDPLRQTAAADVDARQGGEEGIGGVVVETRDLAQVHQGRKLLGQCAGQRVGLGPQQVGDRRRRTDLVQILAEGDVEFGGVDLVEALGEDHRSDIGLELVEDRLQLGHVDQ